MDKIKKALNSYNTILNIIKKDNKLLTTERVKHLKQELTEAMNYMPCCESVKINRLEFVHIDDRSKIKELTNNIFIPTEGDMLVINDGDFLVTQRTIDYDENIITVYVDG